MEQIIKQTRQVGTSAGVLLPKTWLNKTVVVTPYKTPKKIIVKEVIQILIEKKLLREVKGIYLIGSYARNDCDFDSDIDILIITNNLNKIINKDNYEIALISEKNLLKNIQNNIYTLSSIKEAISLLNSELLKKYKKIKIKLKINKIIEEISRITSINQEMIKLSQRKIPDGTIYSLVLRLRELYLIKCLISNKMQNKKEFLNIIGERPYNAYSRIKKNKKGLNNVSQEEAIKLLNLLKKWLKELKGQKKEKKV